LISGPVPPEHTYATALTPKARTIFATPALQSRHAATFVGLVAVDHVNAAGPRFAAPPGPAAAATRKGLDSSSSALSYQRMPIDRRRSTPSHCTATSRQARIAFGFALVLAFATACETATQKPAGVPPVAQGKDEAPVTAATTSSRIPPVGPPIKCAESGDCPPGLACWAPQHTRLLACERSCNSDNDCAPEDRCAPYGGSSAGGGPQSCTSRDAARSSTPRP
jgi:hypothetical protein